MLVLGSVLSAKEAVFVKLELRLRLVLDNNEVLLAKLKLRLRLAFANKEVLFAKFELRLWLALINLKERLRFGFELRYELALISKLSASENDLASDSSFAFGLLSSRSFRPRASLSAYSHLETFSLSPQTSILSPQTSNL